MDFKTKNTLSNSSLGYLCSYLVDKHHAFEHNELSLLKIYLTSAVKIDGGKFQEIALLKRSFDQLWPKLEGHLKKEKHLLFPIGKEVQQENSSIHPDLLLLIESSIEHFRQEHSEIKTILSEIKNVMASPKLEKIASPTGKLCLLELEKLDMDVKKMFEIEEEILYPKLLDLLHFHNGEKVLVDKTTNQPKKSEKKLFNKP